MRINSGTAYTARARTLLAGIAVLLVATLGQVTGTVAGANQSPASTATGAIRIAGSESGRTFDGLGGMSVSAESRLLFDYPPKERSEILDYLFCSPMVKAAAGYCTSGIYGAALQRLKVEIGADTDSTVGAEPSIERQRGVVDCNVGWEFKLMAEARKRNPSIKFEALAWGFPGWIHPGGPSPARYAYGRVISQDTIDYLQNYLGCAAKNGTPIDTLGIWNESPYLIDYRSQSEQWIVQLRAALDSTGYSHVQLTTDDSYYPSFGWAPLRICAAPQTADDVAYCNAVSTFGTHYPSPQAWLHQNNQYSAGAYRHTWSVSDTAGYSTSLRFTGTSIKWIADTCYNAGMVDVYLDGERVAHDLDLYSPSDAPGATSVGCVFQQVLFSRTGLANGQHTIKIVVTGDENPKSASPWWIYSDAFAVDGPPDGTTSTGPCSVQKCIDDTDPSVQYSSVPSTAGKPLWTTEDSPPLYDVTDGIDWYHHPILRSDWPGARYLAQELTTNYIGTGITAEDHYSLISSYYDQAQYAKAGIMTADTPWAASGSAPSYDVQSAIWVMAHTTQFTQPGSWRYVGDPSNPDETASCYLGTPSCTDSTGETGSYVTLRDTSSGDYAIVAETKDATAAQPEQFCLSGGLSTTTVHVWQTNAQTGFANVANLPTTGGCFSYTLAPDAVYTFTSENTGHAGATTQNYTEQGMSLPYQDNFQRYGPARTQPRYFLDQQGAFETGHQCPPGGRQWCLQQVVTSEPIKWLEHSEPQTVIGNLGWKDYTVQTHLTIPTTGQSASVIGRLQQAANDGDQGEKGRYQAEVTKTGPGTWTWTLYRVGSAPSWDQDPNYVVLRSGSYSNGSAWITLALRMVGSQLSVLLDGKPVGAASDGAYAEGMAGLATGTQGASGTRSYDVAYFDDFRVKQPGPALAQGPVVGPTDPNPVLASSGEPVTVSTTVTNPGTQRATNVSANLQVPDGWTATPVDAPTTINGGTTAKFSWQLQASSATAPGAYQATLAVSYDAGGVSWAGQPTTFPLYLDIGPLDKAKMTATATSSQPGYEPGLAIDGDPNTFWHTEFTPDHALPPQAITLDLGGLYDVYQLTYLPRQDGAPNGDITSYNVYTSSDGQTFTKAASGTWPGDASTKTVSFTANRVRYVRLEGVQGVLDYVNAAEIGIFGRTAQ